MNGGLRMITRRDLLTGGAACLAASCTPKSGDTSGPKKLMAITMDDFNLGFDIGLSPQARNEAILEAFALHDHKAAGFVTGAFVESEFGHSVVQSWSDAGHLIGNHTWSHLNSSDEDADKIKADILKNDTALSKYEGYEKVLRFPFLAEGGSPEKVADYRAFMDKHGFANAPVTIDSIDWFTTDRMEKRLTADPQRDIQDYRNYYIQAVRDISEQKHQLALRLGYTNLPHTLLVHHNVLNGLFLIDVMNVLAADGWRFVDAKEALAHPLYKLRPETPNRGRSVLSVLAQEQGVDPQFLPAYRGWGKETMESLGL